VGVYGRPGSERLGDRLQYARTISQNIVVPETQQAPAALAQRGISTVVLAWAGMVAPIGLDD